MLLRTMFIITNCLLIYMINNSYSTIAFNNKAFLSEAIAINPKATSSALQHICWSRQGPESITILEFVTDKLIECIMTPNGVHIIYRAYFHVFSELMLTEAVDLTVAFHSVIPTLLIKVSISYYY